MDRIDTPLAIVLIGILWAAVIFLAVIAFVGAWRMEIKSRDEERKARYGAYGALKKGTGTMPGKVNK
jgi:hypothetical protein